MFASSLPVMIELSCARTVQRGLSLTEHNPWNVLLGGSPRIHAGEGALQRSGRSSVLITRFSAGDQNPGLKPISKSRRSSAGLKSSSPAEAGGSHQSLSHSFSAARAGTGRNAVRLVWHRTVGGLKSGAFPFPAKFAP